MITFDADFIFKVAGGSKGVLEICVKYAPNEVPPNPATVAVWKHRGRISSEWMPVVAFALLVDHGVPALDLFRGLPAEPVPAIVSPEDVGL